MKFNIEQLTDLRDGKKFTRENLMSDDGKWTGFSFDYDSEDSSEKIELWRKETLKSYEEGIEQVLRKKERIANFKSNPEHYKALVDMETKKVPKIEDFGLGESGNYLQSLEEGEFIIKKIYKFKDTASKEDIDTIKQAISSNIFE